MLQPFIKFVPNNSTLRVIPLDSIEATNTWVRECVECGGGKVNVSTGAVGASVHDSCVDGPALVLCMFFISNNNNIL
jgi:hypothetical protein